MKPYLYKEKAYKRSGTSTVEVDLVELRRLVLLGENLCFDMLKSKKAEVSFNYLFDAIKNKLVVDKPNLDTLKVLGLYSTNAGLLLADKNDFPGIDIARFGNSISNILFRETIAGLSILEQLDRAVTVFETFYKYEEVSGMERTTNYLVPLGAFREALANALLHRTWDTRSHIRVLMHPDKIEIFSPGGLPHGLSEEEYLNGYVSTFRNPIIANVFFRLKIVEMFGTGIRRIRESYTNIKHKPIFDIKDNSILVLLPTSDMKETMYPDEKTIYSSLSSGIYLASSDLVRETGFSKDKTIRLVNSLIGKNYVVKEGTGRGTKYRIR